MTPLSQIEIQIKCMSKSTNSEPANEEGMSSSKEEIVRGLNDDLAQECKFRFVLCMKEYTRHFCLLFSVYHLYYFLTMTAVIT